MVGIDGSTRRRLIKARDDLRARHRLDPNVTGFAVGFRERDGQMTTTPAVVVYVARKRRPGLVARDRLLPRTVSVDDEPIDVDVVQAGPFYFLALGSQRTQGRPSGDLVAEHDNRIRPARAGASIGHFEVTAGTLGSLVRDNTNGSLQILSNNHVLANRSTENLPEAVVGDSILQPGSADGGVSPDDVIARLTRWVPYSTSNANTVDCAIARPVDDAEVSTDVMDDQMDPVGPDNPAVGLYFAGDCTGRSFACKMSNVLDELDVRLLDGPDALVEPEIGMLVHKVGRTTEYTSASIVRTDVTGIQVPLNDEVSLEFDDLFEVAAFAHKGDSGSVVCAGGQGDSPTDDRCGGCLLAGPAADKYDLPLRDDVPLADRIRDEFLGATLTGRLLVRLFYVNQDFVSEIIEEIYTDDTIKSYAQAYYDKWRDWIEGALDNPSSPAPVVTTELYDDFRFALNNHFAQYLWADEQAAAYACGDIIAELIGSSFPDVLDYMDLPSTFERVDGIFQNVSTIDSADPLGGPDEQGSP